MFRMDLAYSSELQCIMYVNGDCDQPDFKTARYIEGVTKKQLLKLLKKLNSDEVNFSDILFLVRSQIRLLIRIVRNAEIQERKETIKIRKLRRRREDLDDALKIIDFKDRLRNTLESTEDPIKTEMRHRDGKVRMIYKPLWVYLADRITLLSDSEYEHFAYCKRASFAGFFGSTPHWLNLKSELLPLKNIRMEQLGQLDKKEQYDRFKKWLFMKEKPKEFTDNAIEALIVVANETAAMLVRKSLEVKNRNDTLQAALAIHDVEEAFSELKDQNNCNPIGLFHKTLDQLTIFDTVQF